MIERSNDLVIPIHMGRAAYAWVLTNEAETASAKSADDIWTNPKYMSSFRAELEGAHDMLTYARKVLTPDKALEIWCDSKSVLQVLDTTKQPSPVELSNPEGKLVQQTRNLLKYFPRASLNHVKGHQDDEVWYEDLEYQARLNIDCDREAKDNARFY